jgi:hypothetical protein
LSTHFAHIRRPHEAEEQFLHESVSIRKHPYKTLIEALMMNSHLEATDPRDKIYALLGLVADIDPTTYEINYEAPIAQVYTNVAVHMLHYSSSLVFLCACSAQSKEY